jgi:hypothetical protein
VKILQEITDWDVPNHVYFTNDSKDKIYAYIKASGGAVERFKVPMKFKVSGRKFREVPNTFGYSIDDKPEVPEVAGKQYQVPGSKGAIYTVTNDAGSWTCTCPASRWQKGECKHITALKNS